VAVTADGQRIVSCSGDRTVRVWNRASGRLERTLEGASRVHAVAVTADGQRIVYGGGDGTVRVWNLASGRLERTLEGASRVHAVAVTADGQRIVYGGGDGTVRVWNLASGTELAHLFTDTTVCSCADHPRDTTTIVYGDSHGRVVVLSLREPHSAMGTSTR
jgi:WD40 repeat protein